MKKISIAFTFVGAVVGAGFASGREISLYFAHTSLLSPLLSGVVLTLFCYVFLSIGRVGNGDAKLILGKAYRPIDTVVRICSFVSVCAMAAGSEEVVFSLFRFHGGGIITAVLALVIVLFGMEKIKFSNIIIVPAIIVLIALVFFRQKQAVTFEKLSVLPAFTYATMNILSAGSMMVKLGKELNKRDVVVTAAICGIVVTGLILAVFFSIQNHLDKMMPLLSAAEESNLKVIGNIVAYLAIFSTMTGSLSIASDNNMNLSIIITSLALVVSVVGFRLIVDKCYPVLGVAGGIISVLYVVFFVLFVIKNKKTPGLSPGGSDKTIFRPISRY